MQNTSCRSWGGRGVLVMLTIVLIGLHMAKSGTFVAIGQPPIEGDALHYWRDGCRMAAGDWFMARGDVETIRTPAYPCFLALLQLVCGRYALIAVTVGQQLMVFATAMASAWTCARISGSWLGGLCGLTLGLFCISQNALAVYLFSDTLFGLLLTLAVAVLIAWFERPTVATMIVVGLLLGLATLVRPIAQFAWMPIVLAMAFRWRNSPSPPAVGRHVGHHVPIVVVGSMEAGQGARDLNLRRFLLHGACLLGVFAAVVAPWYARNYYCCGQVFLSKTAGITMWMSLFKSNNPLDPAIPFADAPKTKALLARLDGVDLQSHWAVLGALEKQNLTRGEGNDLMQEVCLEAIKAHPWKFIESRLRRFAWFWITPNGVRRPGTREFHLYEGRPVQPTIFESFPLAENYADQAHWRWDGYYRDGKLNWLWHPNPWLYLFAAAVAGCGVVVLLFDRRQRALAVALGLLLLYFAAMTAIGAPPEYRYRMPLEPIMIVCVAGLAAPLAERFFANPRVLAADL